MVRRILITGAGFVNKGAQSMLFIAADELKKRYSDAEIYFACNGEKYNEKQFKIKRLLYTKLSQEIALGEIKHINVIDLKNLVKTAFVNTGDLFRLMDTGKLLKTIDLIVDVSGYTLADINRAYEHEYFLNSIKLAKKYNIPIVLMPQSFGPFNYSEQNQYLLVEMKKLLPYCKAIFAREDDGFEYLSKYFKLSNLKKMPDMVLQNKGIDRGNICTDLYCTDIPDIKTEHNVAVIPNYHCFNEKTTEQIYELYREIISKLLQADKNVYIFRHSSLDLPLCREIAGQFLKDERVHLIEQEFDCIEYNELVKNFEFIICSRYHGCIHAYKNHVPNIILGWAEKYRELAGLLGQEKYVFNILSDELDKEKLMNAISLMIGHSEEEKNVIANKLISIQQNNCFEIFNEIDG